MCIPAVEMSKLTDPLRKQHLALHVSEVVGGARMEVPEHLETLRSYVDPTVRLEETSKLPDFYPETIYLNL